MKNFDTWCTPDVLDVLDIKDNRIKFSFILTTKNPQKLATKDSPNRNTGIEHWKWDFHLFYNPIFIPNVTLEIFLSLGFRILINNLKHIMKRSRILSLASVRFANSPASYPTMFLC